MKRRFGNSMTKKLSIFITLSICLLLSSTMLLYGAENAAIRGLEDLSSEEEAEKCGFIALRECGIEALEKLPLKTIVAGETWVAIGTNQNMVGVFGLDERFINGIQFRTDGAYELYTDRKNKNLYIYVARSFAVYMFDSSGKFIQANGTNNETQIEKNLIKNSTDSKGNQYNLEGPTGIKKIFSKGYSRVTRTDLDGKKERFYESGYEVSRMRIFLLILAMMIVFLLAEWMASWPEVQKKFDRKRRY